MTSLKVGPFEPSLDYIVTLYSAAMADVQMCGIKSISLSVIVFNPLPDTLYQNLHPWQGKM